MFEPAFTNKAKKFLQVGNVHDTGAAKSLERIIGEGSFADIAADFSFTIIRRDAGKAHRTGFNSSHARSKRVLLTHCSGDDLLEIHAYILEEMLRKIAAVKTDGLVGIIGVVVIPVEQRTGSFGSQLQRVHAHNAGNIDFAGAGHALVAHHAHHRAGHDSGILCVETYRRMDWSFFCANASSSFMRAIRPRISERSMVSTEMPLASRIFSL